jgi:hypothetical protein
MSCERGRAVTVKSVVLGTTIAVTLLACLYGYLSYRSLSSEFRALGLR